MKYCSRENIYLDQKNVKGVSSKTHSLYKTGSKSCAQWTKSNLKLLVSTSTISHSHDEIPFLGARYSRIWVKTGKTCTLRGDDQRSEDGTDGTTTLLSRTLAPPAPPCTRARIASESTVDQETGRWQNGERK
jgi:hypothetical protein